MNTPSHVILNLALLGQRSKSHRNSPIFWGALVPDLAMFVFYGWAKLIAQMDESTIWNEAFFTPFWQDIFAVGNSIPLGLLIIALGWGLLWWLKKYDHQSSQRWSPLAIGAIFLAASMILHALQDLPLHADDGHRHFWPLSNFRFVSPISYWDPDHHGGIAALMEFLLVTLASVRVWQLLKSRWSKGLLIVSNGLMWVVYGSFYL